MNGLYRRLRSVLLKGHHYYVKNCLEKFKDSIIVDVGCGINTALACLGAEGYKIGIDVYVPYIRKAKHLRLYEEYICADARYLPLKAKSVDIVVSMEVIEHLTAKEGLHFLEDLDRIARKASIITTPNGYMPQSIFDRNPHQEHRSGWVAADFHKYGYKVVGCAGLKFIRHTPLKIARDNVRMENPRNLAFKFLNAVFFLIADFSEALLHMNANLSEHLVCIKQFNSN
ncbi:MAG: class I SAM-dependent methyltransferase [Candidatus Bathyarchaeia archaeon]